MTRLLFLCAFLLNYCLLSATAQNSIFKEYDIRGIVNEEFEVADTYEIASAIATYFTQKDPEIRSIIIGRDGRTHSLAIKEEICRALQDKGFQVLDIGMCTTPVVYFALQQVGEHPAGLMITASHNPGEYNGIKMCIGHNLISSAEIQIIKDIYNAKSFMANSTQRGSLSFTDMVSTYVDYLVKAFPRLIESEINCIIDCGNGAAGTVLPLLLEKMKWKNMQLLFPEIDGTYPNHIADPSVEKYMQDLKQALAGSDAAFGLGLDGDGDRMGAMTKSGRLIKGDQLLGLYCQPILEKTPGSAVVFDVSSSKSILDLVKSKGGIPHIAATGVAKVKKMMAETGALLGGEMSCHTIFKDRYLGYDDGIYSLMRFIEIMHQSNQTLEEQLAEFPTVFSTPTYRIACPRATCFQIVDELKAQLLEDKNAELITVDGLRVHFPYGWAIVRASNTEPLISIRFEADSAENLLSIKKYFYATISQHIDCEVFFE